MDQRTPHALRALLGATLVALAGATVQAADGTSTAAQRYQAERAVCLSGESHQSQSACLQEANAAYARSRHGGRQSAEGSDFDHNLIARCEPLPDLQQRACVARMHGAGTTSGSVEGGGILRELVVIVPADEADEF